MKSRIRIIGLLLVLIISTVMFSKEAPAQQVNISYQVFYDQLSPYGQWVDYPNYGYIWIPDAGPDFFPYSSSGHWILSDYGWTWVSYYDWGWAPFHYGRWDFDSYFGWFWVPDNEWGPAWVTWRRANGYYGWAPMQPGISINVSFGQGYRNQTDRWIFVRDRYIDSRDINRYYVSRNSYDRILVNSQVINNTYVDNSRNTTYVFGPKREDVQQITGRRVSPVAIRENDRPGQNLTDDQLHIYRPQVVKNNEMNNRPAPSRTVDVKEVKRPSERKPANQPQNVQRQQNVNQSDNNRPERQTNPANQPQNVQRQQNVNQSDNKKQERQTDPANQPQNVQREQNVKKEQNPDQPQNVNRQQNVNRTNNNRQDTKSNTANPQNIDKKTGDSQKAGSAPSQNERKKKQSDAVNPGAKNKRDEKKKSGSETDRR